MLGLGDGFAHRQNCGGGGHGVADTDHSLLGNPRLMRLDDGEDGGAQKRKRQTGPIRFSSVWIETIEDGYCGSQGRYLGQRQIDEYHAAFYYMDTQIGVNAGQYQTGNERRQEE